MSKRFIDTGIFDDEWFMDLSKEAKLLWIYMITKCDHAGIIKLNEKLCKVQTEIKDLNDVIKQLGNRLVTLNKDLTNSLNYFIPKFIEFQYPGFPNSRVRQQMSAVEILSKYGLIINGKLTLSKDLTKSYVNGNVNGLVIVTNNDTINSEDELSKLIEIPNGFYPVLKKWIEYKAEKGEYLKQLVLEAFVRELYRLSNGDIKTANRIVDVSISGNYAGIFELKNNFKNKQDFSPEPKYKDL